MKMTIQLRWSSLASMIGGLVFPFALLLHPTHATNTFYTPIHILIGVTLVLLLLGLPAVYVGQKTRRRNDGLLIGVLLASIGTALQVSYVLVDGFLAPAMTSSFPSSTLSPADVHLLFLRSVGPLALLVLVSEFVFVGGYLLLGQQTMRAEMFPRWVGLLLISGAVLFGTQILLPMFVAELGAALLGVAFLEIGYAHLFQAGNEQEL